MMENPEAAELRRQLALERERALNAVDALHGARAEAAEARAKVRELEYLLHVRDGELQLLMASAEVGRSSQPGADASGTGWSAAASQLAQGTGRAISRLRSDEARAVAAARVADLRAVSSRWRGQRGQR